MSELKDKELEIQVSSTTLGYRGEGGKIGGIGALAEKIVSKEIYTRTVAENAERFKEITEGEIPQAQFGVSVLASAVNPEGFKEMIRSVDYPYLINWGPAFLKEKWEKGKKEGFNGLGAAVAFGQELAYAFLQSSKYYDQFNDTVNVANMVELNPVRIRTSIEVLSFEDELKRIKAITAQLGNTSRNVTWVLEPNKKVGDGTLQEFLVTYDQILTDNPTLRFGIDLDMGGIPNEDPNLLNILDRLDRNGRLPIFLSLSGKDYKEDDVVTHLPLGRDIELNRQVGEWFKVKQMRGQKLPGIIIETSPTQEDVFKDYSEFLKSFKKGLLSY